MVGEHNYAKYIIEYECGELDEQDTLDLFQFLVDSGLAWTLQRHYGRTAKLLIEAGRIEDAGRV